MEQQEQLFSDNEGDQPEDEHVHLPYGALHNDSASDSEFEQDIIDATSESDASNADAIRQQSQRAKLYFARDRAIGQSYQPVEAEPVDEHNDNAAVNVEIELVERSSASDTSSQVVAVISEAEQVLLAAPGRTHRKSYSRVKTTRKQFEQTGLKPFCNPATGDEAYIPTRYDVLIKVRMST